MGELDIDNTQSTSAGFSASDTLQRLSSQPLSPRRALRRFYGFDSDPTDIAPKPNQRLPKQEHIDDAEPEHVRQRNTIRRKEKELQQADDWGTLLNKYRYEKSTARFEGQMPQVDRITREKSYVWRERERKFNPVLQSFVDGDQEAKVRQSEQNQQNQIRQAALEKTLKQEGNFDFLTHSKRLQDREDEWRTSDFDAKKKNHKQPSSYFVQEDRDTLFGKNKKLSSLRERIDFNPITLEYKTPNGEERTKSEQEKWENDVNEKYNRQMKTYYDAVQSKFRDEKTEAAAREQDEQIRQKTRETKEKKIPAWKEVAEGFHQNIINNEVVHPEVLSKLDKKHEASVEARKHYDQVIEKYKAFEDVKHEFTAQGNLQKRANKLRAREFIQPPRDYEILANKPFQGTDSVKPLIPPQKLRQDSLWSQVVRPESDATVSVPSPTSAAFPARTGSADPILQSRAASAINIGPSHSIEQFIDYRKSLASTEKAAHSKKEVITTIVPGRRVTRLQNARKEDLASHEPRKDLGNGLVVTHRQRLPPFSISKTEVPVDISSWKDNEIRTGGFKRPVQQFDTSLNAHSKRLQESLKGCQVTYIKPLTVAYSAPLISDAYVPTYSLTLKAS